MAGRLLANLIVMGGAVVGRAMVQAFRQAIVNANKTGAAQEAMNGIRRASKAMTEQEARQILGISEKSSWEEIMQKCQERELLSPVEGPLGQRMPGICIS